jgi:methionyl-tRNA formyltransferase
MKNRVLFMGTPEFAVSILECLLESDVDVIGVVSQPDKPIGRKQILTPTPVKKLALDHRIPIYQPNKIKELTETIQNLNLDLIVTCAYGQFIPTAILEAPKYGSVNVHASLLPKYRGGAPIHKALINGESESGVTLMRMVKAMDAGNMIASVIVPITEDDDVGSLHDKLKVAGATLLKAKLPLLLQADVPSYPQDENLVTFAYNIAPEEEFISFRRDVNTVYNHIRGLSPWPIGHGVINGNKLKLIKAFKITQSHDHTLGEFVAFEKGLKIACLNGYVVITHCQYEGKERMDAAAFYNGLGKTLIHGIFE